MIDNPRSPRVRSVAKLAKRNAREETGLFLVEGPQAVAEALTFHADKVVDLYITKQARDRNGDLVQAATSAGLTVELVSDHVLDVMSDTVTPQGVLAICRQFPISLDDLLATKPRLVAILEEVRDPGNAGTIIRAADAAGAGLQVLVADVKGADLPKVRGILSEPTAWVFGNEAHGLTDENLRLADRVVKVPIYGHAESLNLATAASVCLYESAFAQRSH